jgi:hypothetical protein
VKRPGLLPPPVVPVGAGLDFPSRLNYAIPTILLSGVSRVFKFCTSEGGVRVILSRKLLHVLEPDRLDCFMIWSLDTTPKSSAELLQSIYLCTF